MGSKKVKIIDDSITEESTKEPKSRKVKTSGKGGDNTAGHLFEPGESDQSAQATASSTSDEPVLSKSKEASSTGKDSAARDKKQIKKSPKKEPKVSRGKKYEEAKKKVDASKNYPLNEAVELAQQTSFTGFDGTIEAHFNLKSKASRASLTLPHPLGKTSSKTILVFADGVDNIVSKDKNLMAGNEQTVEKILSGDLVPGRDFQLVISTPAYMTELARVAKTLGPKGLMPNPKNGTIAENVEEAIKNFQGGQMEIKSDPISPIVHIGVGKVSWKSADTEENVNTLVETLGENNIAKLTLNATMGPGIHVEI